MRNSFKPPNVIDFLVKVRNLLYEHLLGEAFQELINLISVTAFQFLVDNVISNQGSCQRAGKIQCEREWGDNLGPLQEIALAAYPIVEVPGDSPLV